MYVLYCGGRGGVLLGSSSKGYALGTSEKDSSSCNFWPTVAFTKATLFQDASSQWLSIARLSEKGSVGWIWVSSNGQPWHGDSHQLDGCFLKTMPLSEVFLPQYFFLQISAPHYSLKVPIAWSCSLPYYPSKAFPQCISCTSNSVWLLRGLEGTNWQNFCYPVLSGSKFLLRFLLWLPCYL